MAALDKVIELQRQGKQDVEITKTLTDEGVSPQEINDALNQAKVKTAVSQDPSQQPPASGQEAPPQTQEMQQSIMQAQTPAEPEQAPTQEQQEYYYPEMPQAYPETSYYDQAPAMNTDVISEIAEQVVLEKFEDFKRKTGDLASFKNQVVDKLEDLDTRLTKIEDSIEKLQQAVIGKVGEFGESTSAIHKDLDNLHQSFSKLANPLIDNYKELKKIAKGK